MKSAPQSFAHYRSVSTEEEAWGLVVRAGGCIVNERGEAYPPEGHPADHAFSWERGRVLGGWQVVAITAGAGFFDTQAVKAGGVIFVTPGRWHRYRPSAVTGWTELWVELAGECLERLTAKGVLPRECAVLRPGKFDELAEAMGMLLRAIRERDAGAPGPEFAALAMRALGLLSEKTTEAGSPMERAVRKAERLLAENPVAPPPIPALARELGMNYASFRRAFAKSAGVAPRQYAARLRLEKAQRLIGSTSFTLEIIAERLGFSSAFHLSAAFKKHFGVSPAKWRQGKTRE